MFQGPHTQTSLYSSALTQALEIDGNLVTAATTEKLDFLQFGGLAQ